MVQLRVDFWFILEKPGFHPAYDSLDNEMTYAVSPAGPADSLYFPFGARPRNQLSPAKPKAGFRPTKEEPPQTGNSIKNNQWYGSHEFNEYPSCTSPNPSTGYLGTQRMAPRRRTRPTVCTVLSLKQKVKAYHLPKAKRYRRRRHVGNEQFGVRSSDQ